MKKPMAFGRNLKKKWDLAVNSALFHRGGTWYNQPKRYPVALCDPDGYVVFDDKQSLESAPGVYSGKKINILAGISSFKDYRLADNPVIDTTLIYKL